MKILFITPLSMHHNIRWLPMGPGYISSLLKKNGHEVMLYDRYLQGQLLGGKGSINEGMRTRIMEFDPDIIGFTTMSPVIHDTVECVKYVRTFFDGTIIAGGHHATAMPEQCLEKIPGLDHAATGEAEYTMLSLAEGEDPSGIPGLFSRDLNNSDSIPAHIKNLDDLPFPDYGIFDMNYYTEANNSTIKSFYLRTACILTSRGCPNNCKYCSESLNFGKGVSYHDPDYVIENIERLVSDYNVNGIYFHDNNFLISPSHAENICKKLIKSGLNKKIKWEMQTGTPTVNDDIVQLLVQAGCVKIEFGIESIKDSDLKNMRKNANTDKNTKAMDLCHKNGIKIHTNFMTGFDGESIADLKNTLEWIKVNKPHTYSFHRISIYPGTELYEMSGNGFFENNEWTEENINKYFQSNNFDSIEQEERKRWFKEVYTPFTTRHNRKAILGVNSLKDIIKMAYKKIFSH